MIPPDFLQDVTIAEGVVVEVIIINVENVLVLVTLPMANFVIVRVGVGAVTVMGGSNVLPDTNVDGGGVKVEVVSTVLTTVMVLVLVVVVVMVGQSEVLASVTVTVG